MNSQELELVKQKKFAIVEFIDEESVEIISTNWIQLETNILKGFWPPYPCFKTKQLLLSHMEPGPKWNCYKIRVLHSTGKYFTSIFVLRMKNATFQNLTYHVL